MKNFIDLRTIYDSENIFGDFSIYIDEHNLEATEKIRDFYGFSDSLKKDYTFVLKKISTDQVLMTDSEFELLSNKHFIDNATGDVLILGLGLGMVVLPLLDDDSINSITIIEQEQDIIDYVGAKIKKLDLKNKVNIKLGDAYEYYKNTDEYGKYDYVYIDFWPSLNKSAFKDMDEMLITYKPMKKDENSFLRCWSYELKTII